MVLLISGSGSHKKSDYPMDNLIFLGIHLSKIKFTAGESDI
jgi:hypothetical protein